MARKSTALQAPQKHSEISPERLAGDRWVSMSNALTRAGHGLTLAEKRLVVMALSKLDSRADVPPESRSMRTRITALEYAACFDVSPPTAYEQLRDAADTLLKRIITAYEPAYRRGGAPIKVSKMHWVGQCDYHAGEGWVELHWWHRLLPHLLGLKAHFTSYQLRQASALRSAYSWRLLELLTRFESTGWAQYTIEDFCVSMDASEKQRSDFAKIRTKIIEPAVRELREKDGWLIDWQPIKKGRKVAGVRFDFKRDPQTRLELT